MRSWERVLRALITAKYFIEGKVSDDGEITREATLALLEKTLVEMISHPLSLAVNLQKPDETMTVLTCPECVRQLPQQPSMIYARLLSDKRELELHVRKEYGPPLGASVRVYAA